MGILKKMGAFFSYDETRLGQGRENAKEFLKQHQSLAQEIEHQVRSTATIAQEAPSFPTVSESATADSID
jgi:recombination protein RecA